MIKCAAAATRSCAVRMMLLPAILLAQSVAGGDNALSSQLAPADMTSTNTGRLEIRCPDWSLMKEDPEAFLKGIRILREPANLCDEDKHALGVIIASVWAVSSSKGKPVEADRSWPIIDCLFRQREEFRGVSERMGTAERVNIAELWAVLEKISRENMQGMAVSNSAQKAVTRDLNSSVPMGLEPVDLPARIEFHAADVRPGGDGIEMIDPVTKEKVYVHSMVLLSNEQIRAASWTPSGIGDAGCEVTVVFTRDGQERFASITSTMRGKRLAILLDGRLLAAPSITETMNGKAVQVYPLSAADAKRLTRGIGPRVKAEGAGRNKQHSN